MSEQENNSGQSLFEFPGDDIEIHNGFLMVTYPLYVAPEADLSKVVNSIEEASIDKSTLLNSYRLQSSRTFKDRYFNNLRRFELPERRLHIDNLFDEERFDTRIVFTVHEEERICLLTLWIHINDSYDIREYIQAKRGINDERRLVILHQGPDCRFPMDYLSELTEDSDSIFTPSDFNYSVTLIVNSSISEDLMDICQKPTKWNWESRQLYALITGNSLQWCRGMRHEEVRAALSEDMDWRTGTGTWVQKFSSTTIFSEIPNEYLKLRAKQEEEDFLTRLRHTVSYEVIVGEFLILRASTIERYLMKVATSIENDNSTGMMDIVHLRKDILRYFDYFSSERSLREYLDNKGHFRRIASASEIATLEKNLRESLELLEKTIENKRAITESQRDFNIQLFLLLAETIILISVVNSILSGQVRIDALVISVLVSVTLMLAVFIFDVKSIFQEHILSRN